MNRKFSPLPARAAAAHALPAPASRAAAGGAAGVPAFLRRAAVPEHGLGSGRPLERGTREQMEARFGRGLSRVRLHTGGAAAEAARCVNARAFARGRDIVFDAGEYRPDTREGQRLLAHELAHVIQQGGETGTAPPARPAGMGPSGDAAEQRADGAGERVARGEQAGEVGHATSGVLQRMVRTNGGEWDTSTYAAAGPSTGAGSRVGADIGLSFTPVEPVEAPAIGLVQTVRTFKSSGPATGLDTVAVPRGSPNKASITLTAAEGDEGRAIDQGDSGDADTLPNTNPLYNVENTPGAVSATLTDVGASSSYGTHAHRTARAAGGFDVGAATLSDRPRRVVDFAGQLWRQDFEAAALVLNGALAGTYLGSVAWGWQLDAAGAVTLVPPVLTVVRAGPPTADFMAAARKWNAARFTDPTTGVTYDTLDLPVTTVTAGNVAAADMPTGDLITRIALVAGELGSLAAGADRNQKEFEKRLLEFELARRRIRVRVQVHETEDWTGADEVYVTGSGGSTVGRAGAKGLNDGENGVFFLSLGAVLGSPPAVGPITIRVLDEDWPDADDLMWEHVWSAPFADFSDTQARDGGRYEVAVEFER